MSYILHKNDVPPYAYRPELPADLPELPPCFSNPPFRGPHPPGTYIPNEKLDLESLEGRWQNQMETESQLAGDAPVISRFRRRFLNLLSGNPFVPFTLRGTVFIFSVVGLGLAARIFILTKIQGGDKFHQQPSVIMALVVLSVALVYLVYSTYNEFFGQPLGLRSASSKMMFIMVDLVFIIFASSNLSLAFNTLYDSSWICQVEYKQFSVCSRQRDLVGVLFVSLCFWLATFSVSLFRMIHKAAS